MTLDEAIEHANQRAVFRDMCGQEHAKLVKWLKELKTLRYKYKKLGKEADWLADNLADVCMDNDNCNLCPLDYVCCYPGGSSKDKWREAARKAVEAPQCKSN